MLGVRQERESLAGRIAALRSLREVAGREASKQAMYRAGVIGRGLVARGVVELVIVNGRQHYVVPEKPAESDEDQVKA